MSYVCNVSENNQSRECQRAVEAVEILSRFDRSVTVAALIRPLSTGAALIALTPIHLPFIPYPLPLLPAH